MNKDFIKSFEWLHKVVLRNVHSVHDCNEQSPAECGFCIEVMNAGDLLEGVKKDARKAIKNKAKRRVNQAKAKLN